MKKLLSCLKDKYIIAGIIYGFTDGVFSIFDNWGEFFLYLIPYILIIFCLELLYNKFITK